MRILVLGTSNSILHGGYVDGLRESLPGADIVNRSIGASPGIQFGSICTEDLTSYDAVIFDSVVNDENQAAYVGAGEYFQTVLFEILSTIASQTHLFVMGFCNQKTYHRQSAQFRMHQICAAECGATFCDIHDFFKDNPDLSPQYLDGAHIALPIAFKFGQSLGSQIVSIPRSAMSPNSYASKFYTYDAAMLSKNAYTKKNRLGEWRFGLLEGIASSLILPRPETPEFGRDKVILGLYIDRTHTDCTLRVSSETGERQDVSMRFDIGNANSWVQFIPFKNGARGDRLSLVDSAGAPSPLEVKSDAAMACRAAISKIVCWKRR